MKTLSDPIYVICPAEANAVSQMQACGCQGLGDGGTGRDCWRVRGLLWEMKMSQDETLVMVAQHEIY